MLALDERSPAAELGGLNGGPAEQVDVKVLDHFVAHFKFGVDGFRLRKRDLRFGVDHHLGHQLPRVNLDEAFLAVHLGFDGRGFVQVPFRRGGERVLEGVDDQVHADAFFLGNAAYRRRDVKALHVFVFVFPFHESNPSFGII